MGGGRIRPPMPRGQARRGWKKSQKKERGIQLTQVVDALPRGKQAAPHATGHVVGVLHRLVGHDGAAPTQGFPASSNGHRVEATAKLE
jgi:hypothetical protein